MALSANEIVDALVRSFPAKRPVGLPIIATDGPRYPGDEYEQTEGAFRDKDDWTAIDPAFLDLGQNSAVLSFMSDAAKRFYLPSYLRADLRGLLSRVDPSFALIVGFEEQNERQRNEELASSFEKGGVQPPPPSSGARSRHLWSPLTREQVEAIVRYLEWVVERDGRSVAAGAVEALDTYWHLRVAELGDN